LKLLPIHGAVDTKEIGEPGGDAGDNLVLALRGVDLGNILSRIMQGTFRGEMYLDLDDALLIAVANERVGMLRGALLA
jgi:hypothetical protein